MAGNIFRNIAVWGTLGIAGLFGMGCSNTAPKQDPIVAAAKTQIQKNNQAYDNWEKRFEVRNDLYEKRMRLEVNKRNTNIGFDAEKAKLERDIGETFFDDYDVSGNGDDKPKAKDSSSNYKSLFIGPYLEKRTPKSLVDDCLIDMGDLGTINLNGIEFGFGGERGYGRIKIGQNKSTFLENSNFGEEYSKINTELTSLSMGGLYDFLKTDNFSLGLYLDLLANQEKIDGYSIDNLSGRTDIDKVDYSSGLGAGLKLSCTPFRGVELSYSAGKNFYSNSDAIKNEWAEQFALTFKTKF